MSILKGFLTPSPSGRHQDKSKSLQPIETYQGLDRLRLHVNSSSGLAQFGNKSPLSSHQPGYVVNSFVEQFYNRIAIIPDSFNLGAISTDQTLTVQVWNAWLKTQTLLSVTVENGEGISISGVTPPVKFSRLSIRRWIIEVSTEGPPVINCVITWHFAGLPAAKLIITGTRSAVWSFAPDWSDDVTENLEWKTAVLQSQTGAEQRRSLRLTPRRTFEFRTVATGQTRQLFENMVYEYGQRAWSLPIWPDAWHLTQFIASGATTIPVDTRGRDFQAKAMAVMMQGDTTEALEVAQVLDDAIILARPLQHDYSVGAVLYPARSAFLTDTPKITRHNDDAMSAQIRLQVTEHNKNSDAHSLPLYRGHPVLEPGPNWVDDLTLSFSRNMLTLDNSTGVIKRTDPARRAFINQSYSWLLHGRQEQAVLRRVFYYLRGRQRPVWVSTDASDFTLSTNVLGNTLDVLACGFSNNDKSMPGRQDIRIQLSDHKILYRRIVGATLITNNVERLAFDGDALDLQVNEVVKISFMSLCRQNSDTVSWSHKTDADGVAIVEQNFIGVRDELE